MSDLQKYHSTSPTETLEIAKKLGEQIHSAKIVLLVGNLGAGKTLFAKGICQGLGLKELWEVDSPTYTLMNQYATQPPTIHFDLYRIKDESELESLSFYEIMESQNIKIIEWPDRLIHYIMPQDGYMVQLEKTGNLTRQISISAFQREA